MQRKRSPAGPPHHAGMTDAIAPPGQRVTELPEALLRRMQGQGPRYLSYPTADRFGASVDAAELERALAARRELSDAGVCTPLSVQVRVPSAGFDGDVRGPDPRAAEYVDALGLEVALVNDQVGACRAVSDLHLGGGSPTVLPDAGLDRLMGTIRRSFFLTHDAELSIDVDPCRVQADRVRHLRRLGFNGIRLCVHDFDPDVRRAMQREQAFEQAQALMPSAREAGFASIALELVYGLPGQTPQGLQRTLAQAAGLRPDRILLRAYSNRPGRSGARPHGDAAPLPDDSQRCALLGAALAVLGAQGYQYVGDDQFAPPPRDVQGCRTRPDRDQIGLGVSAIGRIGDCAYQNEDTLDGYYAALEANRLPVARGFLLDADDRVRRDVIAALVCQGRVDFDDILERHGVDMRQAFVDELVRLAPLAADGLVDLHGDGIRVTASGWYVVRAIAMVFDRHLRSGARIARVE